MQNQHRNKINQAVTNPKISEPKFFEQSNLIKNFYLLLTLITQTKTQNLFSRIKRRKKRLQSQNQISRNLLSRKK